MKAEIRVMQLQAMNAKAAQPTTCSWEEAREDFSPGFRRAWLCCHLDFRVLASRTERNTLSLFQAPGLRHLATTTPGNCQSIFLFVPFLKNKKVLNNFFKILKYPEI